METTKQRQKLKEKKKTSRRPVHYFIEEEEEEERKRHVFTQPVKNYVFGRIGNKIITGYLFYSLYNYVNTLISLNHK